MEFYVKHGKSDKYLTTYTQWIEPCHVYLIEELKKHNKLASSDMLIIDKFIHDLKKNFQFSPKALTHYSVDGILLSQDNWENYLGFYSSIGPEKFQNKKVTIEYDSPEKLYEKYSFFINFSKQMGKVVSIIENHKDFLLTIQSDFLKKIKEDPVYKKKIVDEINLNTQGYDNQQILKKLDNEDMFLQTTHLKAFFTSPNYLQTIKGKIKDLSVNFEDWGVELADNKTKYFDGKAYVILVTYKGKPNGVNMAKFLSSRGGEGGLAGAQLFTTSQDATTSANRRYGINGNYSVFEVDINIAKLMVDNCKDGSTITNEILALSEQKKMEEFFKNNDIEKIKAKLLDFENKNNEVKNSRPDLYKKLKI